MPKRKSDHPIDDKTAKKRTTEDDDKDESSGSNYSDNELSSNSSDSEDLGDEPEPSDGDQSDESDEEESKDRIKEESDSHPDSEDEDSDSDFGRQLKSKPIKVNPVWQFEVKELKSAIKAVRRGMPVSHASKKFGISGLVISKHAANYPVKRSKLSAGVSKNASEIKKETDVKTETDSDD